MKRKIIGKSGTFPIYNNYGDVKVKKIKDHKNRIAYEITIPRRPKIFGKGKTRTEIKYMNTVIEYAEAAAYLIKKKKEKGQWK